MLRVHEVAERLGVHPATVYRWIQAGLIPAYRYGRLVIPGPRSGKGGAIRIPQDAVRIPETV